MNFYMECEYIQIERNTIHVGEETNKEDRRDFNCN